VVHHSSPSYCFFRASLICLLFALTSTMNTRVLFSSIFFIALSVLRGWMRIFAASRRGRWGIDLREYFGARESSRVLGRWKDVDCDLLARPNIERSPFTHNIERRRSVVGDGLLTYQSHFADLVRIDLFEIQQ